MLFEPAFVVAVRALAAALLAAFSRWCFPVPLSLTGWALQRVVRGLLAVVPRRLAPALRRCPGVLDPASAGWRWVLLMTLIASSRAVSGRLHPDLGSSTFSRGSVFLLRLL